MKDEVIFRRRQRLKYHFVNTSKVLLYGYRELSDAAKITYQVIDGFDWEDKETGDSKGYAFPATETIAQIRGASDRTIRRHLTELEAVGLLTRVRRRNKPSILYIEDVSEAETDQYVSQYVNPKTSGSGTSGGGKSGSSSSANRASKNVAQKSTTDKNVRSRQAPETTKMSVLDEPISNPGKEKEELKKKKYVNVVQRTGQGMQSIQQLVNAYQPSGEKQAGRVGQTEQVIKRDFIAQNLADELADPGGLGCYRVIADKLPEPVIYQILAEVKQTAQLGQVRSSRAAVFVSAVKQYARQQNIPLGFGKRRFSNLTSQSLASSP